MLDDTQLEALRAQYGQVGIIDWAGHQIVFRRPGRGEIRDYRRKIDSPAEKPDALDQLAQVSLAAFDGDTDPVRSRQTFLAFLDEYPGFTSNRDKVLPVLTILAGMVEEDAAAALGKGASVRSALRPSTPTASPSGPGASPTTGS